LSHEQEFGELRSVLQKTPSLRAWYKVCRILERWPEEGLREIALPYFKANIAHSEWASARRPAPMRWAQEWLDGQKHAYFDLIDGFHLESVELDARQLARLVASPITQELVSLSLIDAKLSNSALDILFSAHFPNLLSLDLSRNNLSGFMGALAKSSFQGQLDQLSMREGLLDNEDMHFLLEATFDNLELLDLRSNHLGEAAMAKLAETSNLPMLRALGISDNAHIPETCDMSALNNIRHSHFPAAPDDFELY